MLLQYTNSDLVHVGKWRPVGIAVLPTGLLGTDPRYGENNWISLYLSPLFQEFDLTESGVLADGSIEVGQRRKRRR